MEFEVLPEETDVTCHYPACDGRRAVVQYSNGKCHCILHADPKPDLPGGTVTAFATQFLDACQSGLNSGGSCRLEGIVVPAEGLTAALPPKKKISLVNCSGGSIRLHIPARLETLEVVGSKFQGSVYIDYGHVNGEEDGSVRLSECQFDRLRLWARMDTIRIERCDILTSAAFYTGPDPKIDVTHSMGSGVLEIASIFPHEKKAVSKDNGLRGDFYGNRGLEIRLVYLPMSGRRFDRLSVGCISFEACEWDIVGGRIEIPLPSHIGRDDREAWQDIAETNRALKRKLLLDHDYRNAYAAHAAEVHALRLRNRNWLSRYFFSWEALYWLASNYGTSWRRPLAWAVVVWLLVWVIGSAVVCYYSQGAVDLQGRLVLTQDLANFFEYHWRNAFFMKLPERQPLGLAFLSTVSKIITTSLSVLAGFAVRRRFR